MNENQVEKLLLQIEDVGLNTDIYDRPDEVDWDLFRETFHTDFGETFVSFTNLMSKFVFTGESYKITSDNKNLNESIYSVYKHESSYPTWNANMLPILGYGNGDFICLSIADGSSSSVYLYEHEENSFTIISESFSEWLIETDGYG